MVQTEKFVRWVNNSYQTLPVKYINKEAPQPTLSEGLDSALVHRAVAAAHKNYGAKAKFPPNGEILLLRNKGDREIDGFLNYGDGKTPSRFYTSSTKEERLGTWRVMDYFGKVLSGQVQFAGRSRKPSQAPAQIADARPKALSLMA